MATDPRVETIALLRRIAVAVEKLAGISGGSEVADDADLDGKYGDPKVNFKPRDWSGDDFKGMHYSECPSEFLELLSKSLDYFAKKAEETGEEYNGKPTAPYKRKDAARARGWAKRNRSKPEQQPVAAGGGFADSSEWPEGAGDDAGWQ